MGRNGGTDFYAHDVKELRREGAESLRVFLEECERRSVSPRKNHQGNFFLRLALKLPAGQHRRCCGRQVSEHLYPECRASGHG